MEMTTIMIVFLSLLTIYAIESLGERYMKGNHLTYEATEILDGLWKVFMRDYGHRSWWNKKRKIMTAVKPDIIEFVLRQAMDEIENKKGESCLLIWMQERSDSINSDLKKK
jgi:hypothetical protein